MFDPRHLPHALPDERIVHFLRRHPITLFGLIVGYLLLFVSPLIVWWYLVMAAPETLDNQPLMVAIILGGSTFFLYAWLFLFQNFMDYYLDIWVVTSRRVLNIEQTGLFSRTVSELRLYRIQDVTATVSGIFHTIFDYGNVEIQTAGEKVRFVFEDIPHPNRIAKTLLELAEVDRREHLDEAVEEFGFAQKKNTSAP